MLVVRRGEEGGEKKGRRQHRMFARAWVIQLLSKVMLGGRGCASFERLWGKVGGVLSADCTWDKRFVVYASGGVAA